MKLYTEDDVTDERGTIALILWNLLQAVDELHSICAEVVDHKDARLVAAGNAIVHVMASFDSLQEMENLSNKVFGTLTNHAPAPQDPAP